MIYNMCFLDCFYENEDSECSIETFEKPKDGYCKGKLRCITCETIISRDEFNKGIEMCKDCEKLIEAYQKGFN